MKLHWLSASIRLTLMVVLVAAIPVTSLAQPDASQLWTMSTVEVHHDMIPEFEELQKELSAAYKKAGATQRLVSQVVRGPSATYLFMTPVAKWADYDDADLVTEAMGEAEGARWIARITKCVKERRVDTIQTRADLSIPLADGRTPKLAVWTTRRNLPGKYPEYNDWLVNKWMPAVKQAGMNGYFTSRNAFGGNAREWINFSLVDSWAAFDQEHPVLRSLGQEKWRELRTGVGAMTTAPVRRILRLRRDLGIVPSSSTSQ